MIKDFKHAKAVQTRRHKAGKLGIAKAVRRYLQRTEGAPFDSYDAAKKSLPVAWPIWAEE